MSSSRIGLMAAVIACLAFAPGTFAGIVDLTRATTVRISGAGSELTFADEDGTTALGPFSRELSDDISNEGGTTRAIARQTSDVAADGSGSANGYAVSQVAEFGGHAAEALSSFEMTFRVTNHRASLTLDGTVGASPHGAAGVTLASGEAGVLFEQAIEVGFPSTFYFDETVALAPGRYRLSGVANTVGTPEGGAASFQLAFTFDANGGGGAAIPLPPALVPGLIGLTALALRLRSRRGAV